MAIRTKNFAAVLRASLENQEAPVDGVGVVNDPVSPETPEQDPEIVIAAPEGGEDLVEVIDPSELEGELIAADDAEDVVNDVLDEAEDVAEAAEGLESILNLVRAEMGGLTPATARWVQVSMEAFIGKDSMVAGLVPSAESFGGETSRQKATVSLEANINETLQKAWDYIRELFIKAYKWVIEFAQRIFNAASGLKHRADALAAREIDGQPKENSLDVAAIAPRYSVQGKLPSSFAAFYQSLAQQITAVSEADNVAAAASSALEESLNKLATVDDDGFDSWHGEAAEKQKGVTKLPAIFKANGDGTYSTPVFPGEVYYIAEIRDGVVSLEAKRNEVESEGAKVTVLSAGDIKSAAQAASTFAAKAVELDQSLKTLTKAKQQAVLKSLKDNTALSPENKRKAESFVRGASRSQAQLDHLVITMIKDAVKAGAAGFSVVEKSAAQYGKPVVAPAQLQQA